MSNDDTPSSKDNKDFLKEARLHPGTRRPRPKRKLVPSNVKVSKTPKLNDIVNDALNIIGSELSSYTKKINKGLMLDLKEARIVTSYMDSLVKMTKEARETQEAQRKDVLQHLTDEQLLEIAQQAQDEDTQQNSDT